MALTNAQTKAAMRIAIDGMIPELESGDLIVDERGAVMHYVARIPEENPQAFAVAFLFLSDDERAQSELYLRLEKYLAAGLPDIE